MNYLEQGTTRYNDNQMNNAPYTQITTGRIMGSTIDGWNVMVNNKTYTKVLRLNAVTLAVNDIVQVVIPNNNYNNMYILGKLTL